MKLKLQSLIIFQLITLLLVTVTALGFTSYHFNQQTAKELRERVLVDTNHDVYSEIVRLLDSTRAHNAYENHRVQSEQPTSADFPRMAQSWVRALVTKPELAFIALSLENGETLGVARAADQTPYVREWRIDPTTKLLTLSVHDPENYPGKARYTTTDHALEELEQRPGYALRETSRPANTPGPNATASRESRAPAVCRAPPASAAFTTRTANAAACLPSAWTCSSSANSSRC